MCQPSPGPRCANHTREKRNRLSRKVRDLAARVSDLNAAEEQMTRNGERFPKAKVREREKLVVRHRKAMEDFRLAVREYDGTKTGQRELAAKIARAKTEEERKRLVSRKKEGAMLNAWRKNALERKNSEVEYTFPYVMSQSA